MREKSSSNHPPAPPFYTTKNSAPSRQTSKIKKYDPKARKHVLYRNQAEVTTASVTPRSGNGRI